VSTNPKQRLLDHNKKLGAKFTKYGNFNLVFLENHSDLSAARRREIQIKKWRRDKKDYLIDLYKRELPTN